jgi:transposase
MKYRKFNNEFKKQMVEQMLSGEVNAVELCRQHNLTRSMLYLWKTQYEKGSLENSSRASKSEQVKIQELERMVGRLTMDNELLKKALALARSQQNSNVGSFGKTKVYSEVLPGGVAC